MNRGPWQATVHGVARVVHNLVSKPPPPPPPPCQWYKITNRKREYMKVEERKMFKALLTHSSSVRNV